MLSRLSEQFYSCAKGWLILSLFATLVLFTTATVPLLDLVYPAATDMRSLDSPVFYTPQEIFLIVESWGNAGRAYQFWFHLTWDIIVPILGLLFFGLFISWLFQRGFKPDSKMRRSNLVALGSIFDLLENFCIATIIMVYPSRPVVVAWLKTIFTMSKYGFGAMIILLILIGLIKAAMNRFAIQ
jgi:hypothetical protein